jgi:hypothetical protein
MPLWCRYCHKENHTKFNCPLSKARIICYACHEHGHRSFECPNSSTIKKPTGKSMQLKVPTVLTPDIAPIPHIVP